MNSTDKRSDETPVDLAAVQADDAFLDLLGSDGHVSDDELARVLVAWRRDVDAEPIRQRVDAATALRVVLEAQAWLAGGATLVLILGPAAMVLLAGLFTPLGQQLVESCPEAGPR